MTFGNGANGCLGHGNLLDVKEVHSILKPVILHQYHAMYFVYPLETIINSFKEIFLFFSLKLLKRLLESKLSKSRAARCTLWLSQVFLFDNFT